MPKTMLIDATHPEETRVAVVDGNRLVEYDYESKVRKQLKGSVFLAKVTRVEPSLQAAFVNFGGNRHGFLPFSEIHPDYFRIPVADREALIAAQRAELEEHDEEMEQAEAALEQAAEHADDVAAAALCTEDDSDDEEEIEPVVEVGGEHPLLDDEDDHDLEDRSYNNSDAIDHNFIEESAPVESAAVHFETEQEQPADTEQEPDAPKKRSRRRTRTSAMTSTDDVLRGPSLEEEPVEEKQSAFEPLPEQDELSEDRNTEDFHSETYNDQDAEAFAADSGFESESSHDGALLPEEGLAGQDDGLSQTGEGRGRNARGRGRFGRGRFNGGNGGRNGGGRGRQGGRSNGGADRDDRSVDTLGGDTAEGDRPFRFNLKRNYKIQEVIKRGQIMLIQVSKEERGNKGAAVTTYLSMPGRYCVLMPNSPRGGGVSRKIASFKDRKRMKETLDDLAVPDGMSVILRTAGVTRTKVEIKRDLDYLTRLWNTIREHTLQSTAPALIYEEGSLIKRAIRDLYTRDIEDVHVSGGEGFRAAREFMKMLMPSHAKKVQEYKNDRVPMFHKFGVENQIYDMGEPVVNLKSGGYLVINPTEALVSVDVNSGRATKERHIEDTALKTNLEAADEVARQLRLRDLGGLVVVDFIDMEDRRNNRKVEQRLRDALSSDRARIQVGRISSFGLLELSRQRMNPSLAEAQQEVCPHCAGTGRVKTLDFSAISIIRALEVEGIKGKGTDIVLTLASSVALYILNNKRAALADIENRYGFTVSFTTDDTMSTSQYRMESVARFVQKAPEGVSVSASEAISEGDDFDADMADSDMDVGTDGDERTSASRNQSPREEGGEDRNGRRRGRRGGRGRNGRDGAREGRARGPEREDAPRSFADNDNEGNIIEPDAPFIDDDIGNRNPEENEGDDTRGNRRPRGERKPQGDRPQGDKPVGEQRRRSRGGRGRGAGRGQDRDNQRVGEPQDAPRPQIDGNAAPDMMGANTQPFPAAPLPRVEAVPMAQAPIAVVNAPRQQEPSVPRDYETINMAPEKKKKGWWNKLIE